MDIFGGAIIMPAGVSDILDSSPCIIHTGMIGICCKLWLMYMNMKNENMNMHVEEGNCCLFYDRVRQ